LRIQEKRLAEKLAVFFANTSELRAQLWPLQTIAEVRASKLTEVDPGQTNRKLTKHPLVSTNRTLTMLTMFPWNFRLTRWTLIQLSEKKPRDSGVGVVVSSMRKLESATKGVNRLTVSIQRNFDRQLLEVAGLGLSVTR